MLNSSNDERTKVSVSFAMHPIRTSTTGVNLVVGLALTLSLALVACGGAGAEGTTSTTPPPPVIPKTIKGIYRPNLNKTTSAPKTQGFAAATVSTTLNMTVARVNHSALKLANGNVFIVGGRPRLYGPLLSNTEFFLTEQEGFAPGPDMNVPRAFPAVCELPDGRVVVLGGSMVEDYRIDLYDPTTGTWGVAPCQEINQQSGDVGSPGVTAFSFPNGKILLYGGRVGAESMRNPVLIDTNPTPWTVRTLSTDQIHQRERFASLKLMDGRVLFSGGNPENLTTLPQATNSLIIYDPSTETFDTTLSMLAPRLRHGILQHPDGKVQIYGGVREDFNTATFELSVETLNLQTGVSTRVGTLIQGRGEMASTRLQNGQTLHGGGWNQFGNATDTQVTYDYATNASLFTGQMAKPRTAFTSVLLNNGRVAYIGGFTDSTGLALNTCEIFDAYSAIMLNAPESMKLGQTTQISIVQGGSVSFTASVGSFDQTGNYTAPPAADPETDPTSVVITATSTTDPTSKVQVVILLEP